MKMIRLICLIGLVHGVAPAATENSKPPHPIGMADIPGWEHIVITALSNDGQWFAYRVSPNEGDSKIVLRRIKDGNETSIPSGEAQTGDVQRTMKFSEDSKWVALGIAPTAKEVKKLKRAKTPIYYKLLLIELATGKRTEFEKIQRSAFSGDRGGWLAMYKYPPEAQPKDKDKTVVSDLLLAELATGNVLSVGNVSEWAFDKQGDWCAWIVDAAGKIGNGLQLRNMRTGAVTSLDSGKADYKQLTWTEDGTGLLVVKGVEDKDFETPRYSLLAYKTFTQPGPEKVVFDPKEYPGFPAGMTVSPTQKPAWTDDRDALLFGIHELRKKKKDDKADKPSDGKDAAPGALADDERPTLIIWNGNDRRLQTQQQVQEAMDKNFNFLSEYRLDTRKFYQLAGEQMRQVTVAPKQHYAMGFDDTPYELQATLDGRVYRDVYAIDLKTGKRTVALKKARFVLSPSPDGSHFLYHEDGNFLTWDMANGKSYNITKNVPSVFWNQENDQNVVKPPTSVIGWTRNGASVLISDNWDIWNIPVHGGTATNLTVNGRKDKIRYHRRFRLDNEERDRGIDLSSPLYLAALDERTKKGGVARIDNGKPGAKMLLWDDAYFGEVDKAKNADVFVYSRENNKESHNYYVSDASLANGQRMTDANPQQKDVLWSPGARLIDFTSAKGDKLQAALFLPANYEPGKKYPTIVYIYQKLTQNLNLNGLLTAFNFNKSIYTSNGYAVLMPDIVYKVDDPGMSAVWCVVPALKAAIETGVVDKDRVGLHGHSWGGYQTAFLVTQTNMFHAAVAGAPLTDMISMWGSIYGQTGGANQAIFESGQARLSHPFWEDTASYIRNSPVFHASKVQTPLLILDNDKDEAVDWNQGVEYFNALRRLHKPVVLLEYKGEGHMMRNAANNKDYTVRMQEFFDYYLKGQPAPAWLSEGVSYLKLRDYLDERTRELRKLESGPEEKMNKPEKPEKP